MRKHVVMNDVKLYQQMKVQAAMRDMPIGCLYQKAAREWLADNQMSTKQWLKK